ncbi:MAG: hypothetical protein AUG49_20170 [Catenulispora sp. 13_1_20CM_3_70_7]|nr:MAG: hypothetical protein AUG49_20170 [Catenulispora sp. 13_1_20CM_3_70_7]
MTRVVRDAFGRVVTVTDPLGSVTEYHWTVEGKPLFRVDPDGSRTGWEYDAEGQVISAVDPLGGVTRFEPGPFGLITARVDPNGRRYEFDYDTDLKLLTVRNAAGAHWQYDYDDAGRLIAERDFIGRSLAYGYDAAGRLVERTNGLGERVVLERDANGQVVSRRTPAGDFAYSYDAAGRLAAAAGPAGTVEFVHDAAGRVVSETVDGRTISYQYDAVGRRVRRETPGGAVSTWSFDAAGRPVMVEGVAGALSFAFDAAGREVERLLGAGGRLTHEYTAPGELSSLRLWASGRPGAAGDPSSRAEPDHLVLGRDWDYRADGVPVEIADSAGDRRRFTSDATGRVTAVRAATWTESYAYDDFGNVVLADDSRDTTPDGRYETDRTLVRRRGRTSYEYDAAGRLVRATTRTLDGRKKTATYTWDFEDRLTQTQTPDGAVWRYSYDALGRRTSKARVADDGAVLELVTFAWEGFRLAEQRTAAPDGSVVDLTWDYEPNSFRPAAQYSRTWRSETDQAEVDQTFRAIVSDLVGSPTELVTSDGTVTWRSAGGLWGRGAATPAAPGTECPLRFPGQYFDAETGLHYNLHRYYDPRTAAYLTPDPLGLAPAANDHAYVPNPLVWLDPLGLSGCTVTVYRAQTAGGHSERVLIDGEGNVSVTGENMLHVNMSGDIAHTESFGGAGKQIVAFDVPKSFVDKVRTAAIEQRRPSGMSRRQWNIFSSGRPQIDDPKVASDLYGIPHDLFGGENFSELVNAVIPGSGRVVR